ncbi:MAG: VOC family protein [Candidatus Bathyarchaeota archaeon]|nr:VOC family protein [Candidatus Bathyarchaeum tardum]WGM89315.1 MAG: VOC family protein [Candidatus Bathyarchaeum tardum]
MKCPVYRSCVLLVEDVEKSKHFYNVVLGQKIVMDFGENVGFEGGLAIWEKDYALNLIFRDEAKKICVGSNNSEIYFETEDLDNLYERLMKQKVTAIHPVTEHPWGQRAFRVRDPDGHIVEFGESMETVVRRLNMKGLSLEEIAKKSLMPVEFIKMAINKQ